MRRAPLKGKTSVTCIAAAFCAVACATESYHYVPADHRASTAREAIYNEPPDAPSGTVRVQFAGIGDYQARKNGPKTKALHLKLIASNNAQAGNWTLNGSDAFVSFPDGIRTSLLAATPSSLNVPPGGLLGMDLYFPLPEKTKSNSNSADEIAEFDFHWQAFVADRLISETTAFDRVRVPRYYASAAPYGDGWGYYPYGPSYEVGLGFGWGHPW
jgi:hypothetical protein